MLLSWRTGHRGSTKLINVCKLSEFNVGFPIHMLFYAARVSRLLAKGFTSTYPTKCSNQPDGHFAYPPETPSEIGAEINIKRSPLAITFM